MKTPTFSTLRERISYEKAERARIRAKFQADFEDAHAVAVLAGNAANPTPMAVYNPASGATHVVSDGVCGFAYVTIRPRNCKLARFAVDHYCWRSNSWHKRIELSVQDFGQSLARKEAFAEAFAKRMHELGHTEVSWDSRID
jgi:hypothetical protein